MLFVLINVLIIVVIGAICFYLIDRFVRDGRLANLLKILVALVCLAAILQRLLPVPASICSSPDILMAASSGHGTYWWDSSNHSPAACIG